MTSQQRKLQTHLYYIQYVSRCYEKLSYGNRRFQQNMIKFALVYLHFHTRKLTHIWQIQKATSHTESMKNGKARHFLESVQKIAFFFGDCVSVRQKSRATAIYLLYAHLYYRKLFACDLLVHFNFVCMHCCAISQISNQYQQQQQQQRYLHWQQIKYSNSARCVLVQLQLCGK